MMNSSTNRRTFLKTSALGIFAAALPAGCGRVRAKEYKPAKPPNIVWISCEDISPHLGCYGEKKAITPNLDQLAAEGVRYTRAFTVHGVCAPNRSGIITGMYPSTLGSTPMRCRALIPDYVKCFPEYLRNAGYYCTNHSKEDYNFKTPKTAWDESSRKAHWKNRPEGKPFFAVFNFTGTHESKLWNSKDLETTRPKRLKPEEYQDPEQMSIPPIYPDTPAVRKDFARLFERITELDYFTKDRIDELKKAGLYEDTIIFFWSDHGDGLPRAKRWLYDSGTHIPLMVRIPAKYRIGRQGTPGRADDQLINMIDMGPTMLNLVGLDIPEYMQGQPFLGKELPGPRKYIFGTRDRIDERPDLVRSVRDQRFRYVRNFYPFLPYYFYLEYAERCNTLQSLRKRHAEGKLPASAEQFMAARRAEELYDLKNDPWETNNLADNPKDKKQKDHLRNVLIEWMIQTRDTGMIPEPEMNARAKKYGSNWAILHQPGSQAFIRELVELALVAGNPQENDRQLLYESLKHSDAAMRYWAVVGISNLQSTTAKDLQKLVEQKEDSSASVRLAVAGAFIRHGKSKEALDILIREIQPDRPSDIIETALVHLSDMGRQGAPAKEAVQKIQKERGKQKYIGRLSARILKNLKEK